MLRFENNRGVRGGDGLTRRDFLRAGALSAGGLGLSLPQLPARPATQDVNCILLCLVGGPSQLDTWDLKPAAPDTIRGPFRPIHTNVPGIDICEHFPLMSRMADRYAIVRSVHHQTAPIHETGLQLLQTGRLGRDGREYPHYGAVLSHLRGQRPGGPPPFVLLPGPIHHTGVAISHGQGAGFLGARHEPVSVNAVDHAHRAADARLFSPHAKKALDLAGEQDAVRDRYGRHTFGQSCLRARRLVEHGVRLVTVNMFDSVFHEVTWDCHADGGALPSTLDDYKNTLCPMFDQAYSALLEDLRQRGLLATTLVLAMGEFGRTPRLNPRGGRDHWPGVWSILFAGGNVRGGQVIGASDPSGAEPRDRPILPPQVSASVYHALGIDAATRLPDNLPLMEAEPIHELFV